VKPTAIADRADVGTYPVVFMCSELEVSRSGYYAWPLSGPSARARTEDMFTVMTKAAGPRQPRRAAGRLGRPGTPAVS
jgi:putative transposase